MNLTLPCMYVFPLMGPSILKIYALIELERCLDKTCDHCVFNTGLCHVWFGDYEAHIR